jgi:sugar O-acyltransferase (sialic acid O-acetyltransferase NeuD family)
LNRIVLIGGGGFSSEVLEVAIQNNFEVLGYIDNAKTKSDLKYLGNEDDYLPTHNPNDFIFPAFAAVDRKGLARRARILDQFKNYKIPSLISKSATLSKSVKVGRGVFISHGVIINPNSNINDFSIINCRSTIGHNVDISNNTIISGHVFVGGSSKIGEKTLIGPGVTIMHSVNIGKNVIVSIGTVIGRKVPDNKTVVPKISKYI